MPLNPSHEVLITS